MIVRCPYCTHETVEPDVEWADEDDVVEDLCKACEREIYSDELVIP